MDFATEEQIRVGAYYLWEANGRPEGRDLEFWDTAQQSLAEGNHTAAQSAGRAARGNPRSRSATATDRQAGNSAPRRRRRST